MGDPSLKLFFTEGRGRAFFSKNKDINSSFNGDIKNKLKCVLRLEAKRGKEEGPQTPKKKEQKILPLIFMGK